MTRTIHIAHSPDSDDAFMFYALAAGKIDTGGLRYEHELSDIESLNRRALKAPALRDRLARDEVRAVAWLDGASADLRLHHLRPH